MHLSKMANTASTQIDAAVRGLGNLVKLEAVITAICVFIPFILIFGEPAPIRTSISAYYSMGEAQLFYFPLTMAAMLFMVNGAVKEQHWYNVGLGIALAGVILFNTHDFSTLHNISAIAFFGGNVLVFVLFTPRDELWFKVLLAVLVAVGIAGHFVFGWYSLFWAESLSLWIIALHFFLEALGIIG